MTRRERIVVNGEENPEKVKLQKKNYRSKHAEEEKERNKAWILANPDRAREINKKKTKKYRLNHSEREKKGGKLTTLQTCVNLRHIML